MKSLKFILLGVLLNASFLVKSEVAEVFSWKANPGKTAEMIENMAEAAGIQRALGAHVTINQLDVGSQQQVDYVIRFDSIEE